MVAPAHGQSRYVNVSNPTPVHPYTNWATAATNIQEAIDASIGGDTILVTNGVYVLPQAISLNRSVTVESVNGYASTVISGNGSHRCFSLSHSNALVRGFTLTDGASSSGGAVSISAGVVQDCLLKGNRATAGGAAYLSGRGTLRNCVIVSNRVASGSSQVKGGGIYMSSGGIVTSCTVVDNETIKGFYSDAGGGIYCNADGMLILNSIIYRNISQYGANIHHGPATAMPAGAISHCRIGSNPLFVDIDAGDYRLQIASACVDIGLDAEWMSAEVDFGGTPRVLGQSVDIGAYEYVPVSRQLIIDGSPTHFGTAEPLGYGTYSVMELTTVTNRIAIPVVETGGIRYVCSGWVGSGSVPESGNTNVVVFRMQGDSTLTWQWAEGCWLALQATNGVITGSSSGWKPEGETYELHPEPAAGYDFDHWLVNSIDSGVAVPLSVVIREPLLIEAVFKPIPPIETVWEGVSHTNNVDDSTGFGAVSYEYFIGKYEVVCSEYAVFLNSVARTDTYALYNDPIRTYGGITQSGIEGSYSYQTNPGWENKPVTYVSYYDALRYANWLDNGQPDGEQDATTTEDGVYTFTGPQSVGDRNPGWTYALASEYEWYKAAYYDPLTGGYFKYATMSDALPARVPPPGGTNAANYEWAIRSGLAEVGSYVDSPGPFGTYDQNGNVSEWTESDRPNGTKAVRGGSAFSYSYRRGYQLESGNSYDISPGAETMAASAGIGFRVVREATNGLHFLSLMATNGVVTGAHAGWKAVGSKHDLYPVRADGFVFDYWKVDGVDRGRDVPLRVTMSNSLVVEAVFVVARDFGDLPASYGLTMLSNDGARHEFQTLWLGKTVDGEPEGQESADAGMKEGDGDDGSETDDEDGIIAVETWTNGVDGGAIRVEVSGGAGFLSGWIDWNGDDDFLDTGEHVMNMVAVSAGAQIVRFDVSPGVLSGGGSNRFSRFRLAPGAQPSLTTSGLVMDGEVEDYSLPLGGPPMVWLQIDSPFGNPDLSVGNHPFIPGTLLTNRVSSPDVQGTTQYVSEGWTMTGTALESGTNTAVVMNVTNDTVLKWLWSTQYWLSVAADGGGTVSETIDEWRDAGCALEISAEPDLFCEFSHWTGVPGVLSTTNPLRFELDQPRQIEAHFKSVYPVSGWHLYVDSMNATPTPPYTNWQTAATSIQDAIDIVDGADANVFIIVRAGSYVLSSQIVLDKAITLQSESGPETTIVDGDDRVRCLYVNNANAVVEGFTITRGYHESSTYPSYVGGGGVYINSGRVAGCHIVSNRTGRAEGAGVGMRGSAELSNCVISNNVSATGDGGGVFLNKGGRVRNCLVVGNRTGSSSDGGGVYCYYGGTVESCTILDNESTRRGGGVMLLGNSVVRNCIIYDNMAPTGPNHYQYNGGSYTYCCTVPAPSGEGNITNVPSFVDAAAGDYRLRPESPCINAGLLQNWMVSGTDLAGDSRVQDGAVDIGCFEVETAFLADPPRGLPPLEVRFEVADSLRGQTGLIYRWDFENDGIIDAEGVGLTEVEHTYTDWGSYSIRLVLSDGSGDLMSFVRMDLVSVDYDIVYASPEGSSIFPYISWKTAATNIQDAVVAGGSGRLVLVTNGVYGVDRQITVAADLTVRSVNGAENTILQGTDSHRCVKLSHSSALFEGFTVTGGRAIDGGLPGGGGGIQIWNGATVKSCIIHGNYAEGQGGGVKIIEGGTVESCLIYGNACPGYAYNDYGGGGVFMYNGGTVRNCTIVGNTTTDGNGAGLYRYQSGLVENTIVYYNTKNGARSDLLLTGYIQQRKAYHCCTPTVVAGDNNITNAPVFVNIAGSDWRLKSGSPCRDAGRTADWMTNSVDVVGNARVVNRLVDIGAHEFNVTYGITVEGYPDRRGVPLPQSYGLHMLLPGVTASNSVPSIVVASNGVRYVCTGWTGTGDIPATGQTNSVVFMVTTNSLLTWQWKTQYRLETSVLGGGQVTPATSYYDIGEEVAVSAVSTNGTGFTRWLGDVSPALVCEASLALVMSQPRSITADFLSSTRYVSLTGQHLFPYTNWVGAATNIQAAINAAQSTDVVMIAPGTYRGPGNYNISFRGKRLLVTSVGGADMTAIDIERRGCGFLFVSGENRDSALSGISILGGTGQGAAIYCSSSSPSIDHCIMKDSRDGWSLYPLAAVYCKSASPTLSHCTISGTAGQTYVITASGGNVRLLNCLITANAHGIYGYDYANIIVEGCTIAFNSGKSIILKLGSNATLKDCIAWGNAAGQFQISGSLTVTYSCVQGGWPGEENISRSPRFRSLTDLRLTEHSDCVDTGINLSWMGGQNDLVGNARIRNGTVDRGAYEYHPLVSLVVAGNPIEVGTPASHGYGFNEIPLVTLVSNSVDSIVDAGTGTRHLCKGWTGTGDVPVAGSNSVVSFVARTNSLLIWQWETQYWLKLAASNGVIQGASPGWQPEGFVYDLYPSNAVGYVFNHWLTDGVDTGSAVPLRVTINKPLQVEAIFGPAFIDVTDITRSGIVNWEMNRQTGTYMATLEVYNPSNSVKILTEPFWFLLETNQSARLMHPDGIEPVSGLPYTDITERVNQALLLVGDNDTELDPGESVLVHNIEVFSYDRSIPVGYVYGIWADPPGSYNINLNLDIDGDGIPNLWENRFANLSQNNPYDVTEDDDGDGMNNLAEYITDTDPTDRGSVMRIRGIQFASDGIQLSWTGGVQAKQIVEFSRDLKVWYPCHTNQPPTCITNSVHIPGNESPLFFRIRVEGR